VENDEREPLLADLLDEDLRAVSEADAHQATL